MEPKIRVTGGGTGFVIQFEVDDGPAIGAARAKIDGEAVEARFFGLLVGFTPGEAAFEVGGDQVSVAIGDDDAGGSESFGVEPIEGFVDLKAYAIGVGMLAVPFAVPASPKAAGLDMDEVFSFGVGFEGSMAWTEVSVCQQEGGDDLVAVGATNFGTEDRILQHQVHSRYLVQNNGAIDSVGSTISSSIISPAIISG